MVKSKIKDLLLRLPKRTIYGTLGPYLTKYRLVNFGKDRVRVYLHRFYRSDEDRELHSHPWEWSFSIILRGGYTETRENGERVFRPGSVNFIRRTDYHRVELLDPSRCTWTLFVAGPEIDNWYFLDPVTKLTTPWKTFIRNKGMEPGDPTLY